MTNMVTLNDIKELSNKELFNIHNIPEAIHINEDICLDPYLADNLSGNPKTTVYDFNVHLNKYGVNLQRPYVWNIIQQQEFILSILLEKPIPPVVVVDMDLCCGENARPTKRLVIDGKQRLMTIQKFINNEFSIPINGRMCDFNSFDRDVRLRFKRELMFIKATVYYASDNATESDYISDDMKIIIFNYYNFAGTPQEESHKNMLYNLLKK